MAACGFNFNPWYAEEFEANMLCRVRSYLKEIKKKGGGGWGISSLLPREHEFVILSPM